VCCRRDVRRLRRRALLCACSAEGIACNGDADCLSGCAVPVPRCVRHRCVGATPPLVCRTALRAAPGRCTGAWSAHRRAVGSFSVGTYTFTCATDCAGNTCYIDKTGNNLKGTLPDVFDRLTCKSKITYMCAPSARAAPRSIRICKSAHRCASARARGCCVRACALAHTCICHTHTRAPLCSTRVCVSSGFIVSADISPDCAACIRPRLQPRACACVRLCVRFLSETW
jgi:hypothetical protein